jgi:hypothetical protein
MPLRLSEEYAGRIDEDKWEKDFDIDNVKNYITETVIGYILYKMMWYKMREYNDYIL